MNAPEKIQETKKKRRHGPEPRPAEELRRTRVSVFLTEQEANEMRRRAASISFHLSPYFRAAAFNKLPKKIPAINREAWVALARVASNINQYQTAINEGRAGGYPPAVLSELRDMVQALRCDLLGVKLTGEDEANERNEQN